MSIKMFICNLIWLLFISLAKAAEISGIFTKLNSISFRNDDPGGFSDYHPGSPIWTASIAYKIQGDILEPGQILKLGDTFTLTMPCVYKFLDSKPSVDISVNGVIYATCIYFHGQNIVPYSALQCTIDKNIGTLTVTGTLKVPFIFNAGNGGGL